MNDPQLRKNEIYTLEDLRREKARLRSKILSQEQVLKTHYHTLSERVNPVLGVVNFFSGDKLFGGFKNNKAGDEAQKEHSMLKNDLIKLILAAAAGTLLVKSNKKNFLKALSLYALDQGLKFVESKDISEHISTLKNWFTSIEKKEGETKETEQEKS